MNSYYQNQQVTNDLIFFYLSTKTNFYPRCGLALLYVLANNWIDTCKGFFTIKRSLNFNIITVIVCNKSQICWKFGGWGLSLMIIQTYRDFLRYKISNKVAVKMSWSWSMKYTLPKICCFSLIHNGINVNNLLWLSTFIFIHKL